MPLQIVAITNNGWLPVPYEQLGEPSNAIALICVLTNNSFLVNSFILLWGTVPRDLFLTQAGETQALLGEI